MEDKMKIVKSLEKSRLIIKGIIETIKNEVKEQKGRFLSILLGTLPACIIGNILTGKGVIRAGEGVIRPGWKKYKNEPKFNGSHSRNNLSKIIDEAYIINLDKHESIGTHWITLYVNTENIIFLDSFGEYIPNEIRKYIGDKNIKTNIYIIQAYDSMCGYIYIGFIDFV